jgi:CheY-like chemotaxis protein
MRRILLVEDNVINQKVAVALLERQGHVVTTVTDGRGALDALARGSFDLVLMDVELPDMSGYEAAAAVRQSERTTGTHTRIIAMTAHAMAGVRERCLQAGMDGYIAKPLYVKDLFAVIEQGAASAQEGSPALGAGWSLAPSDVPGIRQQ